MVCKRRNIQCTPRTQMTPVLIGKGLVLGVSTFKNRGHLGSRHLMFGSLIPLVTIFWVSTSPKHTAAARLFSQKSKAVRLSMSSPNRCFACPDGCTKTNDVRQNLGNQHGCQYTTSTLPLTAFFTGTDAGTWWVFGGKKTTKQTKTVGGRLSVVFVFFVGSPNFFFGIAQRKMTH